jgi:DNA-binding response OmpR family regulator
MAPSAHDTVPGDSFLAKPFKPEALLAEVDRLLQAGPPPAPENGQESHPG